MTEKTAPASQDMPLDQRFGFGKNWLSYIELLDETRIARAEKSLRDMLGGGIAARQNVPGHRVWQWPVLPGGTASGRNGHRR